MHKIRIGLLLLCIISAACSKKTTNEVVPDPINANTPTTTVTAPVTPTGTISGKALPGGSVKTVMATSLTDGKIYRVNVDSGTGLFILNNLPDGKYALEYTANAYFTGPAKTEVTVTNGNSADAGIATAKEKTFTLSCYVNGQYQGWNWMGYYSPASGLLQITNFNTGGNISGSFDTEIQYRLSINISKLTGPGTYVCDPSTATRITYNGLRDGLALIQQNTGMSGSTGTIVITEFDQTAHTIKGTFTATLAAVGAADAKDITNGIINATFKND